MGLFSKNVALQILEWRWQLTKNQGKWILEVCINTVCGPSYEGNGDDAGEVFPIPKSDGEVNKACWIRSESPQCPESLCGHRHPQNLHFAIKIKDCSVCFFKAKPIWLRKHPDLKWGRLGRWGNISFWWKGLGFKHMRIIFLGHPNHSNFKKQCLM